MTTRLEKATQFEQRAGVAPMLRAINELRRLRPPCSRCRRSEATRVIGLGGDGEPAAVCAHCADAAQLDRRVEQQRATREAMRRRAQDSHQRTENQNRTQTWQNNA